MTWKFNGNTIDPEKLPSVVDVLAVISGNGGKNIDQDLLLHWDYGEYGKILTVQESFDSHYYDGGYLIPVQEGVYSIRYGHPSTGEMNILDIRRSKLVTQEDATDTVEDCLIWEMPEMMSLWEEIAGISNVMNLHEPGEWRS